RWFRITPGTYQVTLAATDRTTSPNFGVYDISTSTQAPAGVGQAMPLDGSMSTSGRVRVALGGATRCLVATGHLLGSYRPLAVVGNMLTPDEVTTPPGSYATLGHRDDDGQAVTFGVDHIGGGMGGVSVTWLPPDSPDPGDGVVWVLPVDPDHQFALFGGLDAYDYLFLESPSLAAPNGGAWAGTDPEGLDAVPVAHLGLRYTH